MSSTRPGRRRPWPRLSIVKHVVEAHGGCVTAASGGRGRGATFIIELPRGTGTSVGQEQKTISHA